MFRRRPVVLVMLLALTAAPALAETMYARYSTPVRAGRTLGSATLGTLAQGQAVQVVGRDGRYFRTVYAGTTGWVYYNKLADTKPEDVSAALGGDLSPGGLELTELESGGALRGLSPMAENYAEAAEIPKWAVDAVEQMQERGVTARELDDFEREGGLGEYAGEDGR